MIDRGCGRFCPRPCSPRGHVMRDGTTSQTNDKKYGTQMDRVLDLIDQAAFDIGCATGVSTRLQCMWLYDGPVKIDDLRQFHEHLQRGRLSRCIERSPLPFGRHRWISSHGSSDIEIVASARPREEFEAWLNEQAHTPLDCEHGPGWHLAVVPFTDGGAGISLVVSHFLADGVGLCEAVADAAGGRDDAISWPAAGSRRRWQALREDARQTVRDIPAVGRGIATVVRVARRTRRERAGTATPPPALPAGADESITFPTATVFVGGDEWKTRANSLGGTSNTLLVGLAARLAQRLGRATADGTLDLGMPVNERTADDTRANANFAVPVTVDPAPATTDLGGIRAAIKQALIRQGEAIAEYRALSTLVPLMPPRLIRRMGGVPNGVLSSNLGVVNPAAGRPDGTDADYFAMKVLYPGMTEAMLHTFGGLLWLVSGQTQNHVFVSVTAYQPGRPNSNDGLRQELSDALGEFSLTGRHL